MPYNKDNYISSVWESTFKIIRDNFTDYIVDIKPVTTPTISESHVIIMNPRPSRFGRKSTYNEEQNKKVRINLFILTDNSNNDGEIGATNIAGNIDSWIERNQYEFSIEGFRNVQIVSAEPFSTGNTNIYGYLCVLEGYVIV